MAELTFFVDGQPQGRPINVCANDKVEVTFPGNNLPLGVAHHPGCDVAKDLALIRGELEKADQRLQRVLELFDDDDRNQVEDLLGLGPTVT